MTTGVQVHFKSKIYVCINTSVFFVFNSGNPFNLIGSVHSFVTTFISSSFLSSVHVLLSHSSMYHEIHDFVIKWKLFLRYWPFVRGIHRSPLNSPHKGQWRRASMFSLICAWINGCVNNHEAGDLRRHRDHYDVSVMCRPLALKL